MARYIDAEELLKKNMYGNANPIVYRTYAENLIKSAPTADVVPKSEVEKLKDEIDRLKYNLKAVLEERSETKQEVVDEFISLMIDSFGVNPYDRMNFDVRDLVELKKKYEVGKDG